MLGDQAGLGYVAEGLHEALLAKLFSLNSVHVAPADATGNIPAKEPLAKIGTQLGANLIVRGMVQFGAGKMAVIVNLSDAASGRLLWTQEFGGVPADLLTLEDQIYTKLVTAMGVEQSSQEMASGALHPTQNVAAYDFYLKGRDAMRHEDNLGSVQTAVNDYQRAIQLDSNFALAYAGLAYASLRMYHLNRNRFWADKALSYAQQAEQLNPNLAEVDFSLGSVYSATGKSAQAIEELKKAIRLSPNSDEGYRRLGDAYLATGQKQDAIQAYQKAAQIDPYYWLNYNKLGIANFMFGNYDKALEAFERIGQLNPESPSGYINSGAVYLQQAKFSQCIPYFQKAIQVLPTPVSYTNLGTAYVYLKRYKEAIQMYQKAVEMNPKQAATVGNLADGYRLAGDSAKAKATYDQAIALAYQELQVNPRDANTMALLATWYAKEGNFNQAVSFIRQARALDTKNVVNTYRQALILALAGRQDEAVKTLADAFQKGYPVAYAENDPNLASLERNAAFLHLVKQFAARRKQT